MVDFFNNNCPHLQNKAPPFLVIVDAEYRHPRDDRTDGFE